MLSNEDWHRRFVLQAGWTEAARRYIFNQINLTSASRVLEVGCGSGAVLSEMQQNTAASIHGLDINRPFLEIARNFSPTSRLTAGDALHLPYSQASFNLTCCHFFLLWVSNPQAALYEMRRVTRPGGFVALLAEPDYGGRIDYPLELEILGQMQTQALQQQGADPGIGRRLGSLLTGAGFHEIHVGLLGGEWQKRCRQIETESEWHVLNADLFGQMTTSQLEALRRLDAAAWEKGERILFVPTFYAWGRV